MTPYLKHISSNPLSARLKNDHKNTSSIRKTQVLSRTKPAALEATRPPQKLTVLTPMKTEAETERSKLESVASEQPLLGTKNVSPAAAKHRQIGGSSSRLHERTSGSK
jgi:hypothetical protein